MKMLKGHNSRRNLDHSAQNRASYIACFLVLKHKICYQKFMKIITHNSDIAMKLGLNLIPSFFF